MGGVHGLKRKNNKSKIVTMYPCWTELRRSNEFDTERVDRRRNNTPHKVYYALWKVVCGMRQKWNWLNVKIFA